MPEIEKRLSDVAKAEIQITSIRVSYSQKKFRYYVLSSGGKISGLLISVSIQSINNAIYLKQKYVNTLNHFQDWLDIM